MWFHVSDAVLTRSKDARSADRQSLSGIYAVDEFARNGVTLAPLLSETARWRWFVIREDDYGSRVTIRTTADAVDQFTASPDTASDPLALADDKTPHRFALRIERADRDHLVIRGDAEGASILAQVHRIDETKFLLLSRGFHWIQEGPFNR